MGISQVAASIAHLPYTRKTRPRRLYVSEVLSFQLFEGKKHMQMCASGLEIYFSCTSQGSRERAHSTYYQLPMRKLRNNNDIIILGISFFCRLLTVISKAL
jgi:hypothetical protein